MATPKELIAQVASVTGIPESTVIVHDRNLAEAGLRSPALRGRGVSRVTYQDAANLLIAVVASRNVKDSVKVVLEYAPLAADIPLNINGGVRGETLGDALAALLEAVPESLDVYHGAGCDQIAVSFFWPQLQAVIEICRNDELVEKITYQTDQSRFATDLVYVARFTQATLAVTGSLVSGFVSIPRKI